MVEMPEGPFLYGEKRVRKVIDYDYWLDKYAVTNEKYRAFILADGYGNRAYWSEEGWKWKTENNIAGSGYWNDPTWNQADHPVVEVSYYEAEAYAKWVGKRLPTEQEWEKAARGEDGREYPWGNEFDKNKCNIIDSPRLRDVFSLQSGSAIGRTTSVTQYPKGVSSYGCYDMAGNVWEWCADWYDEGKDSRVLRGGSWLNRPAYLRVSNRSRYDADFRNCNISFRLVQDIP